ncbi:hypothetical protein Pla22_26580 [Rubripirellula amarantea]|uniref:Uncharacterized protein n=1 Tax=Rubripirellula amarantea TaxID=2527999 RepID=A0A5C5WVM4_9BACT|nr:hypothetical protein Pla22_26580 [Rubripirellula amarantea]
MCRGLAVSAVISLDRYWHSNHVVTGLEYASSIFAHFYPSLIVGQIADFVGRWGGHHQPLLITQLLTQMLTQLLTRGAHD